MKTRSEVSRLPRLQGRLMQKTVGACAVILTLAATGCGRETSRKVLKRYESQFAEKRRQFQNIAQVLPAAGSVKAATAANLSLKPVYDVKNDSYNTEIVMYDQLLDPDITTQGHNRLDLLLSGDLLRGIQWTGPKNPMSESTLDKSAGNLEQNLKKGLGTRYLVVLRPASFVAPVARDEHSYKSGTADTEGFIVDLEGNKVAGSFRFTAQSASKVEYSYKKGESQESRLEEFAYSSLYVDARQKLGNLLRQTTGGQFVLDR